MAKSGVLNIDLSVYLPIAVWIIDSSNNQWDFGTPKILRFLLRRLIHSATLIYRFIIKWILVPMTIGIRFPYLQSLILSKI